MRFTSYLDSLWHFCTDNVAPNDMKWSTMCRKGHTYYCVGCKTYFPVTNFLKKLEHIESYSANQNGIII